MTAALLDGPTSAWRELPARTRQMIWWAGIAVVAAVLLGTTLVLPRTTPAGIIVLGLVNGGLNALLAIGIILVYRTNRVINFAHGELGAFSGVLVSQLVAKDVPYVVAAGCGLASGIVAGAVIELAVIRRFAHAPKLILTVATIALGNLLIFAELGIPVLFGRPVFSSELRTPISRFRFRVSPVTFDGNHLAILAFVVLVVVGLGAFLRSSYGVVVRASAENPDRAALCGIPVARLSTIVWAIAGGLSAVAATLQAPIQGLQIGVLVGPNLLLRALAAAVIGRMQSLPITLAAAFGLGVVEQSVYWSYGRSTVIDAALLGVILVALLLQRKRFSRADDSGTASLVVAQVRPVPGELARLAEVRWGRVAGYTLIAVLALVGPRFLSISKQNLSAVIVIFAIVGLSLVVLTGWAGQISLGQIALVGIGGAVAGSLSADAGWDFVLALVAGAGAGLVAAVVLGLPALRVKGFFLAVTTLAFAVSTSSFLLRQAWLVPAGQVNRPYLFGRLDMENELTYYYVCLGVLALLIVLLGGIRRSAIGRAIVAVRDNERAAQAYGIKATAVKLTAFGISGAVAGIAGGLLVHHQHGLPATQYAPQQSLSVFLLSVIGGLGSIPGAILGALYVKGSQYLLPGAGSFLASGVGVLVLLLVLPKGLGSLVYSGRDALLRRVAERRGIIVASLLADRREETGPSDADLSDEEIAELFAEAPPVLDPATELEGVAP
jgi:branched-chain amino acid transport system permease protein